MKKLLLILVSIVFTMNIVYAQLPIGSYAPDFKLFEIDKSTGNLITTDTIHLYEYLDAGKPTMLDFSATWCNPCWLYHNGHAMKTAYETYGPDGTDELRVLYIEGSYGNYSSLTGGKDASGSASQGNWLNGTPYPMIPTYLSPNTKTVVSDYEVRGYPTLYMVCPNRSVVYMPRTTNTTPSATDIYNYAKACPCFSEIENNAAIFHLIEPTGLYTCTDEVTPQIILQNTGSDTLTKVEFIIDLDGTTSTYEWTGSLTKHEIETVTLHTLSGLSTATHNYTVTINTANDVEDTDSVMNQISTTFTISNESSIMTINENFSSNPNWEINGSLWYYSTGGAMYFFASNASVEYEASEFILPLLNIGNSSSEGFGLSFDVAYAPFYYSRDGNTYYDKLEIQVSTCGSNWTTVYSKRTDLPTTSAVTSQTWGPSSNSQWRTEMINLSSYITTSGSDKFLVKFIGTSWGANVIWIDNLKFGSNVVSVSEMDISNNSITVFPNPANDRITILSDNAEIQKVELYNLQGQLITNQQLNDNTLDISNLSAGMYSVRIITEKGVAVKNIIKK